MRSREDVSALVRHSILIVTVLTWLGGLGLLWLTGATDIRHLASDLTAAYFIAWGLVFVSTKGAREEASTRFILTTFSIVLVLVSFEVLALLRMVDYRIVFSTQILEPWRAPWHIQDDELLHIRRPGQRHVISVRFGDLGGQLCLPGPHVQPYEIKYDRRGFRNNGETPTTDIAIIGDSFVEGYMIPQPALMTSVLERLQHRKVTNLGQGWYGPQQELVVLKRYALPLHPNVIVWLFYEGNDLFDVQRYEEAKVKWAEWSPLFHSAWQRSFTKNALLAILRLSSGCQPGPFSGQIQSGVIHDATGQPVRMYFLYSGHELTPKEEKAFQKAISVLAEAFSSAQAHGARFMVAFVPAKFRVYQGMVEFSPDSDGRDWCANDLPRRLGAALLTISPEIGYIDLTPFFVEAARQGILTYFPNDTHLSEEGHRMTAEAINAALSTDSRVARTP